MASLEELASVFNLGASSEGDWTTLAKVSAVNPDGSLTCYLSGSASPSNVADYCGAQAGDVTLVLVSKGKARAIAIQGGSSPAVLYDDATGTTGTVTLSSSAANFEHMRIYARKSNGQNQCVSADVYAPNGKYANLTVFEPSSGNSGMWFASRTVYINGTSISTNNYANGFIGSSPYGGNSNEVAIYRVEAW